MHTEATRLVEYKPNKRNWEMIALSALADIAQGIAQPSADGQKDGDYVAITDRILASDAILQYLNNRNERKEADMADVTTAKGK